MFYTYIQNNSGGKFVRDLDKGIGYAVIIEADSIDKANVQAEKIGLYFYGSEDGRDCPCCGDRWYKVFDENYNASPNPTIYGRPIITFIKKQLTYKLPVFVHYKDGSIDVYGTSESIAKYRIE